MLGIRYLKAAPTKYVLHYKAGALVREGPGLSFFYFSPTSTLVAVPVSSADLPFVFHESSSDFQTLTVQGQITYRVAEPKRLAALLDYTVDADGHALSKDPEVLGQRLTHEALVLTRAAVGRLTLRDALVASDAIAAEVTESLRHSDAVAMLGVEVLAFSVVSMKPAPETARALEAEAREALLRRADEAIYARRNAAVVAERAIKESELATEIAVEEQRGTLIDRKVENDTKDAESRAHALDVTLRPVKEVDWRTLVAVGGSDARTNIALAFRELAENAQKIGTLHMTPDLLQSILGAKG
jgi:regulator of protease activity HflC (stomatin/prohibitin superfamily)